MSQAGSVSGSSCLGLLAGSSALSLHAGDLPPSPLAPPSPSVCPLALGKLGHVQSVTQCLCGQHPSYTYSFFSDLQSHMAKGPPRPNVCEWPSRPPCPELPPLSASLSQPPEHLCPAHRPAAILKPPSPLLAITDPPHFAFCDFHALSLWCRSSEGPPASTPASLHSTLQPEWSVENARLTSASPVPLQRQKPRGAWGS